MLRIWRMCKYIGIGFRKCPYLPLCMYVCARASPCVFAVTLTLLWLTCPAWLISLDQIAFIDQQIFPSSLVCMSAFHIFSSIICTAEDCFTVRFAPYLFQRKGQNTVFLLLVVYSLWVQLKAITCYFIVQSGANLYAVVKRLVYYLNSHMVVLCGKSSLTKKVIILLTKEQQAELVCRKCYSVENK